MNPNILIENAPSSVIVDGVTLDIDTTWKTGVKTLQALDNPTLTDSKKTFLMLSYYFPDNSTAHKINEHALSHIEEAIEKASLFLNFNEPKKPSSRGTHSPILRVFDWDYDAPRIIADFQREYQIDLSQKGLQMHWWRFWALFRNLSDTSKTIQAISIRGAKPNKNMSKAEKEWLKRKQEEVLLPARTEEEALKLTNFVWSINV